MILEHLVQVDVLHFLLLPELVPELEDLLDVEDELLHEHVVLGVEGEPPVFNLDLEDILALIVGSPVDVRVRVKD